VRARNQESEGKRKGSWGSWGGRGEDFFNGQRTTDNGQRTTDNLLGLILRKVESHGQRTTDNGQLTTDNYLYPFQGLTFNSPLGVNTT
jgi:hypothetical protein